LSFLSPLIKVSLGVRLIKEYRKLYRKETKGVRRKKKRLQLTLGREIAAS
jgi:hypothetical protein